MECTVHSVRKGEIVKVVKPGGRRSGFTGMVTSNCAPHGAMVRFYPDGAIEGFKFESIDRVSSTWEIAVGKLQQRILTAEAGRSAGDHFMLSRLYGQTGERGKEIDHLQNALHAGSLDDDMLSKVHHHLGVALLKRRSSDDVASAITHLTAALPDRNTAPTQWAMMQCKLAAAMAMSKQLTNALSCLDAVIEVSGLKTESPQEWATAHERAAELCKQLARGADEEINHLCAHSQ